MHASLGSSYLMRPGSIHTSPAYPFVLYRMLNLSNICVDILFWLVLVLVLVPITITITITSISYVSNQKVIEGYQYYVLVL